MNSVYVWVLFIAYSGKPVIIDNIHSLSECQRLEAVIQETWIDTKNRNPNTRFPAMAPATRCIEVQKRVVK